MKEQGMREKERTGGQFKFAAIQTECKKVPAFSYLSYDRIDSGRVGALS